MQDDREDRIRRRAHEIWERDGRPDGRHEDHWAQATAEIDAENSGAGKTSKTGGSTSKGSTRAKTAVGGAGEKSTAATPKHGTQTAAENLSAVASGRAEKTGGKTRKAGMEGGSAVSPGAAARGRTARAKKDVTG